MEQGKRDPRMYAIIGAAIEVHNQLGPGFLEAVYHEAVAIEFRRRGIPFAHEVEMPISYKGERLHTGYRADFTCFCDVVIEIKAADGLGPADEAQLLGYLTATGHKVGLLLNFGEGSLKHRRMIK